MERVLFPVNKQVVNYQETFPWENLYNHQLYTNSSSLTHTGSYYVMSCQFVALNPLVDLVKMTWMLTIDGAPVYLRVDQEMLGHCGNNYNKKYVYYLIAKLPNYYPKAYLM